MTERIKVMIVDDSALVRQVVAQAIKREASGAVGNPCLTPRRFMLRAFACATTHLPALGSVK